MSWSLVTRYGSRHVPRRLQRAFDPFFTTKPIGQGSGLGSAWFTGLSSVGRLRADRQHRRAGDDRTDVPARARGRGPGVAHLEQDNLPLGHERICWSRTTNWCAATCARRWHPWLRRRPCATGQEVLGMIKSGVEADLLLTDIILAGGINGHRVRSRSSCSGRPCPCFICPAIPRTPSQDGGLDREFILSASRSAGSRSRPNSARYSPPDSAEMIAHMRGMGMAGKNPVRGSQVDRWRPPRPSRKPARNAARYFSVGAQRAAHRGFAADSAPGQIGRRL